MFALPEKFRHSFPVGHQMYSPPNYAGGGYFVVPHPHEKKLILKVIATPGTDQYPWEHVSVTLGQATNPHPINRCPTWEEMCFVKDLFWGKDDVVVQFHPAESDYVSTHDYCLHLWRKQNQNFETPDPSLVGYVTGKKIN